MCPFPDNIIQRDPNLPRSEYSEILGIKVDKLTLPGLFEKVQKNSLMDGKTLVGYLNIHAFNQCYQYPFFRKFFSSASINICDGFGVKFAAKFLDQTNLNRQTPADWMPEFCGFCAENHLTMYFLGAAKGIADIAAKKLINKYPSLCIVGTHDGYFNKEQNNPENDLVLQEIQVVKPDILLVGFGMPLQEKWVMENWDSLTCKVIMPVGALFDYLSGNVKRAPRWMTDHGLEWLGRMLIEPKRLWKRYIIGNPVFYFHVIQQKLKILHFPSENP